MKMREATSSGGVETHMEDGESSLADLGPDRDREFAAFYRREFSRATALARPLCNSWAVAEELAQDAFLLAHAKWPKISQLDNPGQWVRRVVMNRAVSTYRRSQAERRALRRLGPERRAVEPAGPTDGILSRIADLPPRQAQAIVAVYVDQLDATEAAALLGCSPSTLRTHLQRGRDALRASQPREEDER